MRHQAMAGNAETAGAMDADEITFEDLLEAEPSSTTPADSFAQLLADGFPHKGGLAALAAIRQLPDPGSRFAALQHAYHEILEGQMNKRPTGSQAGAAAAAALGDRLRAELREAAASVPTSAS